jgi:DNA-binding CsgD family transcriptional regulator
MAEAGLARGSIDALATDSLAVVLRPAPLSNSAVAALIATELGQDPDPRFCEACQQATGGNPFLLRELLRELAADGVAPRVERVPFVRQLAPPTVARAVLLRLARLGDDASALARAVAVLGDAAPVHHACALVGLRDDRGDELAAALAQAGILSTARPLAFAHPILRSAVYADIDSAERSRAHRHAAARLAAEGAGADAIAVHLLPTEPSGDTHVVATLREAATRALARGAPPTAATCLRRALSEPPSVIERGRVVLELAAAELRSGDPAAAADHFDEGVRITADPRARAACAREQALALVSLGRRDDAFALLERLVDELTTVDRELALTLEAAAIAIARIEVSRLPWARERLERYRGRLTAATPGERQLLAIQAHIDALQGDQPAEELADCAERALASGKLFDDTRRGEWPGYFFAVDVLLMTDRLEPARRTLDLAMDSARRRGSAPGFAFASGWRCYLRAREGALTDAESDGRSYAELSLPQGWLVFVPRLLGHLLDVLVDRGELDDAEQLLERSGMATRTADEDLTFDALLHARGRLRAARGDLAGARADLAGLDRRTVPPPRWSTYPSLVPALLAAPQLGVEDRAEARALTEKMLLDAHTWGTPRAIGMARRAAGLVEGGTRGLELLQEAAEVLERSPARLEYARALADLGTALRRANQRAAARDPLRRALDLADACGARPLAERARHELRAAGGRPRRPRISGVHALTASEHRIVAMAADGLSNPEIAQALFITKKTVEAHLASAYRKLDIHSRTQIAATLHDSHA